MHRSSKPGKGNSAAQRYADEGGHAATPGKRTATQTRYGHGGNGAPVQRKAAAKGPKKDPKQEAADFESDGPTVVYALAGVFTSTSGGDEMRSYMPGRYHDALAKLLKAKNDEKLDGRQRLALYNEAWAAFGPFVQKNDHFEGADVQLAEHFAWLRKDLLFAEAGSRISNTMVVDEGGKKKAIEIPDDSHPREQGEVLHAELPKLIGSIKKTISRAKTLAGATLGHEAEGLVEKLETMGHVLNLAEGWLLLNDEEFRHELSHVKGVLNGVQTYSELVKTILEMTEASIGLTIQLGGTIAKLVGDEAMEEATKHAGELIGKGFGKIVAGIEIVHGIATVFDSSKSSDERIEGGVEIGAGIGTLAAGSSLGALPIAGPYAMIKLAQSLFSGAALGYEVGILETTFKRLADEGKSISYMSDQLVAAHQLAAAEKDPDRKRAMETQEKVIHDQLSKSLYGFLGDCGDQGHGIGDLDGNTSAQFYPGNIQIIREHFAPVVMMRGSLEGGSIGVVALMVKLTLENIAWCFEHAQAIVKGSALSKHAADMDAMQADIDEKTKPKKEE